MSFMKSSETNDVYTFPKPLKCLCLMVYILKPELHHFGRSKRSEEGSDKTLLSQIFVSEWAKTILTMFKGLLTAHTLIQLEKLHKFRIYLFKECWTVLTIWTRNDL